MTSDVDAGRPLPKWGPADLAASLPPGPMALMDGILVDGRRCALVAWAPAEIAATLEEAVRAGGPGDGAGGCPECPECPGCPGGPGCPGRRHRQHRLGRHAPVLAAWCGGPVRPRRRAAVDAGWPAGGAGRPHSSLRLGRTPHPARPPRCCVPLWGKFRFCEAVRSAQAHMAAGEVAKLILSVPFAAPCAHTPLTVYRRLTAGAPPGLGFILDDGDGRALIGVSPEPLVRLTGRHARLHLLAGTRRSDSGLEADLLAADKDRAEHTVAVEQAQRDLLAVCDPGTVTTDAFMQLERHPGLIHLASDVSGHLRADATPADLIRACFPAGTVGGVPRAAAIALIHQLERIPREWYAGAVGAILPDGDVQLWLTIRTIQLQGGIAVGRTGAGLVRESDPEAEWQECCNKARPTMAAVGAEVVGA